MDKRQVAAIIVIIVIIIVILIVLASLKVRRNRDSRDNSYSDSPDSRSRSSAHHDLRRIATAKNDPTSNPSAPTFKIKPYNRISGSTTGTNRRCDYDGTPIDRLGMASIDSMQTVNGIEEAVAESTNWAGYVGAKSLTKPVNNSCTMVSGTFIIPSLTNADSIKDNNVSIWVGIDGAFATDPTVQQLGVDLTYVNGATQIYAWFEMYPQYSYEISEFPVNTGDSITTTVTYLSGTAKQQYQLSIKNNTKNVSYIVPASYSTSRVATRQAVEWIVEAPAIGNSVVPLSSFTPDVVFTDCTATISGVTGAINKFSNEQINMIKSRNTSVVKATTSTLATTGNGFSVTWVSD